MVLSVRLAHSVIPEHLLSLKTWKTEAVYKERRPGGRQRYQMAKEYLGYLRIDPYHCKVKSNWRHFCAGKSLTQSTFGTSQSRGLFSCVLCRVYVVQQSLNNELGWLDEHTL